MARRSGEKTGWHPRTAGMVICAFFGLGVMTGFSTTGHELTRRATDSVSDLTASIADTLAPARASLVQASASVTGWAHHIGILDDAMNELTHRIVPAELASTSPPIAIVKRGDDFYSLTDNGALSGPISLRDENDLPIVSGVLDDASSSDLLEDTAVLVRAETALSQLVSEMRVNNDGTVTLCLERERTELTIDLDNVPHELDRAQQVMRRLKGREQLIAALDLTTPGEAVVRLRGATVGIKKGGASKVTASVSTTSKVRRQ